MKEKELKKLILGAMFVAVAVALSPFSFPVGAAKCFPTQHLINVLSAVFLGPIYAVGVACSTSLIRNLMGTGSLLAFPGSMIGAFLCGLAYKYSSKISFACVGEVFGTGILGGILAYPVASMFMGKEVGFFFFVVPFLISTVGGSAIAAVLLGSMHKMGLMAYLRRQIDIEKK